MSKRFSGAGDITWSIGSIVGTGAWTIAMLAKLNAGADASWHSMYNLKSGATTRLGATRRGTNNTFSISLADESAFADSIAWSSGQGWTVLVASRPAGAAQTVAYSVCSLGNIFQSGNCTGTLGNAAAPTSQQFGNINGNDDFNGWLGALAYWDTNLNQTQRESLGNLLTRADWLALSPVALYDELDSFDINWVTSTSQRTAISGVTDDPADNPSGWSSWAGAAPPSAVGALESHPEHFGPF